MAGTSKPPGTYRRNSGRGHSYYIDGAKVDGVTTVIGKGLPKTGLYNWAGRESAREAVDNWDELSRLPVMDRYERIAGAANSTRDRAAAKGTQIHKLAERLAAGEPVEVPDHIRGQVEACVAFLDDWEVEPIVSEKPVFSRSHAYAGSPDLFAAVYGGEQALIDWKTNAKGPYGDAAFQVAAYRFADFMLDEAGNEIPVPPVTRTWVVWLRYDGYDVIPMQADARTFKQFLYIQQVAHAAEASRDYRLDALPPPIKITQESA